MQPVANDHTPPVKDGLQPEPDTPETPRYFRIGENGEKIAVTREEFKAYRRKFVTVRYQRIPSCGHKFVPGHGPRHRNCEACWFAFFQVHGELTQSADEVHSKFGIAGLRELRGPKFAKNFVKFMATLAHWQKQVEAAKAANVTSEEPAGGTGSGNESAADAGTVEQTADQAGL